MGSSLHQKFPFWGTLGGLWGVPGERFGVLGDPWGELGASWRAPGPRDAQKLIFERFWCPFGEPNGVQNGQKVSQKSIQFLGRFFTPFREPKVVKKSQKWEPFSNKKRPRNRREPIRAPKRATSSPIEKPI